MENLINTKALAGALAVLVVASAGWLVIERRTNSRLEDKMDGFQLTIDSLLAEKISFTNENKKLKSEVDSLSSKATELDKALGLTTSRLVAKEKELRTKDLSNRTLEMERTKLIVSRDGARKQLTAVTVSDNQLRIENRRLSDKILSLGDSNRSLRNELFQVNQASTDNIEIDGVNKRGKLVVKAGKVRKITAHFGVHSELKKPGFKLYDLSNKLLTENDGVSTWRVVSGGNTPFENETLPKMIDMELTFIPKNKVKSGLYRIEIKNEDLHIGNMLVRFR